MALAWSPWLFLVPLLLPLEMTRLTTGHLLAMVRSAFCCAGPALASNHGAPAPLLQLGRFDRVICVLRHTCWARRRYINCAKSLVSALAAGTVRYGPVPQTVLWL